MPDTHGRPLVFGEVLFDRFPDGSNVLGGAPFNVAWNLQAFGLAPLFVSRVGDDALGAQIGDAMRAWGMDTSGLQIDDTHPTGTVEVHIENNEPRFDIVADSAWDFIDSAHLPQPESPRLLYHGSLALRQPVSAAALAALQRSSAAPAFIDVNLRDPWWQADTVMRQLKTARWAKLNDDELIRLAPGGSDVESRARRLLSDCDLETVIVTRGKQGAISYSADSGSHEITPSGEVNLVDTVGAGDAFASVVIAGLLNEWGLDTTLERAQQFASAVVGMRGATTTEPGFYNPFVNRWRLA